MHYHEIMAEEINKLIRHFREKEKYVPYNENVKIIVLLEEHKVPLKVTINNVVEKVFNSGNEGFEITLDVPGHNEKLWHYLVLDPNNSQKTNQRIGMFFDSFSIQDTNLSNYGNWVGKDGAVRVRHNIYNGSKTANVAFCLSRSQQGRIPVRGEVFNAKDTTSTSPTLGIPQREFNGFSF